MRRTRNAQGERGSAAVEFAIVLPLLIAILLGTIDWGFYFFQREVVVNASREGARVGALQQPNGTTGPAEAKAAALAYIAASLDVNAATVQTDPCPANSSCVRIIYDNGGSVTGFLGSMIPQTIQAYAQMHR